MPWTSVSPAPSRSAGSDGSRGPRPGAARLEERRTRSRRPLWSRTRWALLGAALVPASAVGQAGVGLAPHVGTLGVGLAVGISSPAGRVGARASASVFPLVIGGEASDVEYDVHLPSPSFSAVLDLYPAGEFRLSGGVLTTPNTTFEGDFVGAVEIGNTTYTRADVGRLTGAVVTHDVSPYLGIGVGDPGRGRRTGFYLDVGVALHGRPGFELAADGPLASDPIFQANLELERRDIEDDVAKIRVYPVVAIGVTLRLTR